MSGTATVRRGSHASWRRSADSHGSSVEAFETSTSSYDLPDLPKIRAYFRVPLRCWSLPSVSAGPLPAPAYHLIWCLRSDPTGTRHSRYREFRIHGCTTDARSSKTRLNASGTPPRGRPCAQHVASDVLHPARLPSLLRCIPCLSCQSVEAYRMMNALPRGRKQPPARARHGQPGHRSPAQAAAA